MSKQKNLRRKKIVLLICILTGIIVLLCLAVWKHGEKMRYVKALENGINIGNTLDSAELRKYHPEADELEYETFWRNPPINREQLHAVKTAGFQTVRIPVTWEDHLDEQGMISTKWLNRVIDVVNMALEEDLYVILNTHHEGWLSLEAAQETSMNKELSVLWTQLSEQFQEYDDHLIFEGVNEPRLQGSELEWGEGTEELHQMVNRLN